MKLGERDDMREACLEAWPEGIDVQGGSLDDAGEGLYRDDDGNLWEVVWTEPGNICYFEEYRFGDETRSYGPRGGGR